MEQRMEFYIEDFKDLSAKLEETDKKIQFSVQIYFGVVTACIAVLGNEFLTNHYLLSSVFFIGLGICGIFVLLFVHYGMKLHNSYLNRLNTLRANMLAFTGQSQTEIDKYGYTSVIKPSNRGMTRVLIWALYFAISSFTAASVFYFLHNTFVSLYKSVLVAIFAFPITLLFIYILIRILDRPQKPPKKVDQFSNNKIFFHTDRLCLAREGHITRPIVYELSLSGRCNCRCTYCCCSNYHGDQSLSKNDIDRLVSQLKGSAKAVTITGGGEPLLNPHFSYCVKKMKAQGISVGVITNGLYMSKDIIDTIVRNASFIRISLDTVDPDSYEKLRGIRPDFNKLKENMKLLAKQKLEDKSAILIGAQIVYIDQNIAELEKTIRFVKSTGIDFIQIRPVDNIPGKNLERNYSFYQLNQHSLDQLAKKYSDNHFKTIININKFLEYYSGSVTKKYSKCLGANFTASIGHDMNLYFCCAHLGNPHYSLGSIRENELEQLLFSERRRQLIMEPCFADCQIQCRNHVLNNIMNDLVDMDAQEFSDLLKQKLIAERPQHCEFL